MALPTIHILFENPDWNPPLLAALHRAGFPTALHYLDDGALDPSHPPPQGIWINRISPSSHTRDHAHTVALGREWLFWLELHGRRVINGSRAFELEMSKLRQDLVLRKHGIRSPRTVLGVGPRHLVELAARFDGPFLTKHNQGGKGLGIHRFESAKALEAFLASEAYDPGPDGKILLQEYIASPEPYITRVELVGSRFLFGMHSRTDEGFELCPSDACQLPADVCPADASSSKFSPSDLRADDPLVQALLRLIATEGIEVAGIEYITDHQGRRYVYDINGTTNYSGVLGQRIGIDGMRELVRYLSEQVVPAMARHSAA